MQGRHHLAAFVAALLLCSALPAAYAATTCGGPLTTTGLGEYSYVCSSVTSKVADISFAFGDAIPALTAPNVQIISRRDDPSDGWGELASNPTIPTNNPLFLVVEVKVGWSGAPTSDSMTSVQLIFDHFLDASGAGDVFGNYQLWAPGNFGIKYWNAATTSWEPVNDGSTGCTRTLDYDGTSKYTTDICIPKVASYSKNSFLTFILHSIPEYTDTQSASNTQSASATIAGDPHFIGFAGQKFLIEGTVGKVYNLFSSPTTQVNALFIQSAGVHKYTVMGEIAVVIGNDTIFLSRQARLQVNGKKAHNETLLSDGVSVVRRDSSKQWAGQIIETPEIFIRVMPRGYEVDLKEFKLLRQGGADLHGLLGQTWDAAKWPAKSFVRELTKEEEVWSALEGSIDDYEVKDGMYGFNFKFNRFDVSKLIRRPAVPYFSQSLRQQRRH